MAGGHGLPPNLGPRVQRVSALLLILPRDGRTFNLPIDVGSHRTLPWTASTR
jgi:hypothetical protein